MGPETNVELDSVTEGKREFRICWSVRSREPKASDLGCVWPGICNREKWVLGGWFWWPQEAEKG